MAERDGNRGAVEMVVFVGAESTGKSTLVEYLAREYDTAFVPEIGRSVWEEKNGPKHSEQPMLGTTGLQQLVPQHHLRYFYNRSPVHIFPVPMLEGRWDRSPPLCRRR